MKKQRLFLISMLCLLTLTSCHMIKTRQMNPRLSMIATGWASNSINTVIFRRNAIVTHENTQYAAFYDVESNVMLAKRQLGTDKWEIHQTKAEKDKILNVKLLLICVAMNVLLSHDRYILLVRLTEILF